MSKEELKENVKAAVSDSSSSNEPSSSDSPETQPGPGIEAIKAQPSPSAHLAEMRRNPEAIRELFLTGEYPYISKMSTKDYEHKKQALQVELLKVQRWVKERGEKIVLLF